MAEAVRRIVPCILTTVWVVFCLDNGGSVENNEATGVCDSAEMWKNSKLWSVAASLAVVYFFSPECFGRKAWAQRAWWSETRTLKREILDATPIPLLHLSVFTLCTPPLFPFVSFLFLCVSLFSPLSPQSRRWWSFTPDKSSRCPSFLHRSIPTLPPQFCSSLPFFVFSASIPPLLYTSFSPSLRHELMIWQAVFTSPPPAFICL